MFKFVDLGQVDRVDQRQTGQRTGHHRQHQQYRQRRPAGDLAIAMRRMRRPTGLSVPAQAAQLHRLMCWRCQEIQAPAAFLRRPGQRMPQLKASILANCWHVHEWGAVPLKYKTNRRKVHPKAGAALETTRETVSRADRLETRLHSTSNVAKIGPKSRPPTPVPKGVHKGNVLLSKANKINNIKIDASYLSVITTGFWPVFCQKTAFVPKTAHFYEVLNTRGLSKGEASTALVSGHLLRRFWPSADRAPC